MVAVAATLCLAAACKKPPDPSSTGCTLEAGPDRSAFVFTDGGGLVLLHGDSRWRVPFRAGTCLEHGADIGSDAIIAVLRDGWRAVVVAAHPDSVGGFEPAQWRTTVACVVDFRTGVAVPLAAEVPAELGLEEHARGRLVVVGAASGRIYTWTNDAPPRVFDPTTHQVAPLGGLGDQRLADDCQIGENDREAVLVCPGWQQQDDAGQQHLTVARIASGVWPPTAVLSDIETPSPADRLAMSPDGTALAMWSNGPHAHLRISELVPPARAVDVDREHSAVNAVAIDRDRVFVGISDATASHTEWLRVLDRRGIDLGRVAIRGASRALYPAGPSVLVDTGCNMHWVALPWGALFASALGGGGVRP